MKFYIGTTTLVFAALLCMAIADKRYLLYDCNPGEGFNLRRDVYMRIANMVKNLREQKECKGDDWVLVLPPWGRIGYHWKERDMEQSKIPWSKFFDIPSLAKHVPVIEYDDYVEEIGDAKVDEIWYLQRYEEGWSSGNWEDKMHERPCIDQPVYESEGNSDKIRGWFWGYEETYANKFKCVSVQGSSKIFFGPLCGANTTAQSIMLDRGENILHDMFGGKDYWDCRRSMRFSKELVEEANEFRKKHFGSNDEADKTVMPEDWTEHKCTEGDALGGPYIAAHLRRKDFLYARKDQVPDLEKVAKVLKEKMQEYKVNKVFIASDGTKEEMAQLKTLLPEMVMYKPTKEKKKAFKMGGVAIIDQIICSHARYFTGTKESTFSFRIQEEREIMCFSKDMTFNRICSDQEPKDCEQPTKWKIVWNSDSEIWQ
uniref:GDP-fucose protein O-fucosyltransferase 2 n=1 Tax=Phallusia mammillata TaxID=59560 RepID=A0A6F9DNI8_9ASCI|nr:fut13 protein precursor [Phallusia mammillata]